MLTLTTMGLEGVLTTYSSKRKVVSNLYLILNRGKVLKD